MTKIEEQIITALANGEWHSTAGLAQSLVVDAQTLAQALHGLARFGLRLDAGLGASHRLNGGLELYNSYLIYKELLEHARKHITQLEIHWETDSTNERLLAQSVTENIHGHARLAEFQTAGRGRHGHPWTASFGCGLCLSLGWRFQQGMAADNSLSLAVALALTRALRRFGAEDVTLKWPNDVLWQDRKLAGILVERRWRADRVCDTVIGLGLNLKFPVHFTQALEAGWADLRHVLGRAVSRNAVAAAVLNELCAVLSEYAHAGFAPFVDEWRRHDGLRGRAVTVQTSAGSIGGTAAGISEEGAFLVDVGEERREFYSADVSVRIRA